MAFQSEAAQQSVQQQRNAVAVSDRVEPLNPNAGPVVWKNYQKEGGPIPDLQRKGVTFFELLTNPDYDQLRHDSFEDWCFPDIVTNPNTRRPMVVPVKNIFVNGHQITGPNSAIIGKSSVVQYGYIVLNLMKAPSRSFGEYPGTEFSSTNYLVCVEVGDPRTGRLGNAYIRYALRMSAPLSSCVTLLQSLSYQTGDKDRPQGFQKLYGLVGDTVLENDIYERWWNAGDYYFNGVIYPKLRGYSDTAASRS